MNTFVADLLRWILGVDTRQIPEDAVVRFSWANLPESLWVFVLLLAVFGAGAAAVVLYLMEMDTCSRKAKIFLGVVRVSALAVLLIAFLQPTLEYSERRVVEPLVIVMRDASRSMGAVDSYADDRAAAAVAEALGATPDAIRSESPTRAEVLNRALARDRERFLRKLEERGAVRVMDFSDHVEKQQTRPRSATDPDRQTTLTSLQSDASAGGGSGASQITVPPLEATGKGTDLRLAISEPLSGHTVAAVVVFSDGQHTGADDPRTAALAAKEKEIPVFMVGVGDPTRQRDVQAANVYTRSQAWIGEPFEIQAVVSARGIEEQDVEVQLIEQSLPAEGGEPGAETVLERKRQRLSEGGGQVRIEFSHTAQQAGTFRYSIRVEPVVDERDLENNRVSADVKVLARESIRVLLVSGAPSWEYRMLHRLLQRDKTVTVSGWLQTLDAERSQEGDRQITHLPAKRDELFWYDVVVLLDPNPDEFDEGWIDLLKQFCTEHSGGLLYMAGPKFSGRFLAGSRTKALRDVLPVRFGDVGAMEVATLLSSNQQAWELRVVSQNADHPVLSFYQDRQETLSRWESLPGIYWSFPALEPKPTSLTLLEHSDPTLRQLEGPRPLMVAGRYGPGNTLYLGFNGTWRWRRAGKQAEFFDRFWIQAIRFLVEGRGLEGQRRGFAQTDRDRYEIGDKVNLTARLQDAAFQPLTAPQVEAVLETPGGETTPLVLRKGATQYEATYATREIGKHRVRIPLPAGPEGEQSLVETEFHVDMPAVEMREPWLNKPLLVDLARLSGGQYFEINQLDQLAAAIPDRRETVLAPRFPISLWDNRGLLLLLIGLLCVEWSARKICKLL